MTLPGILADRVYVIDTSSVIEVRRLLSQANRARIDAVFQRLTQLVHEDALCFPMQICDELARGHEVLSGVEDAPFDWAQANRGAAVPDSDLFDAVRSVLQVVPLLVDRDKTSGEDDADPYVVGLAHKLLMEGRHVTVVTDDRRDQPDKISIQSACGLMGIPAMSMRAFLGHLGITLPR